MCNFNNDFTNNVCEKFIQVCASEINIYFTLSDRILSRNA